MGRRPLPDKIKYVKGRAVPIYAKGLTKSEYVMQVRNPERYKEYNRTWRMENREDYNRYQREYYRRAKNTFKAGVPEQRGAVQPGPVQREPIPRGPAPRQPAQMQPSGIGFRNWIQKPTDLRNRFNTKIRRG